MNKQEYSKEIFCFANNRGPVHKWTIKITGRLSDLMNIS